MKPVRRAGWVRAESYTPAARSFAGWVYVRRRGALAFLSYSLLLGFPRSCAQSLHASTAHVTPPCRLSRDARGERGISSMRRELWC